MLPSILCTNEAFADSFRGVARPLALDPERDYSIAVCAWLRCEERALFLAEHGCDFTKPYESTTNPRLSEWFANHFISICLQVEVQLP